jgi:hypothetical protein
MVSSPARRPILFVICDLRFVICYFHTVAGSLEKLQGEFVQALKFNGLK